MPKAEDGLKFRAEEAGSWTVDPVASHAACQLDEVEAILSNDQEKEFKMTLENSNGSEVCAITLNPNTDEVLLKSEDLRSSDGTGTFWYLNVRRTLNELSYKLRKAHHPAKNESSRKS